jgi:hypothetical protein
MVGLLLSAELVGCSLADVDWRVGWAAGTGSCHCQRHALQQRRCK